MSDLNNIRAQAEQFLGYFARLKDRKLDDTFRFWAESKDFDKETRKAIRREVDLSACGHAQQAGFSSKGNRTEGWIRNI